MTVVQTRPHTDAAPFRAASPPAEDRYRMLFDAIDEGFCVVEMVFDEDGRAVDYRFLEANSAFERHTGLKNAVGRTAREMVPALEAHWFEAYGGVARTGEPRRFVAEAQPMGARAFGVYAFRLGGEGSRQVGILFTDVSQRLRAEERLRRRSEQLQALAEASLVFAQAPTLEATLDEITRAARRIIGAHLAVVSLTRGPDWSQAINAVDLSDRYAAWRDDDALPDGSGISAWVCEQNRPARMTQAELLAHPRWRGFGRRSAEHPPLRGWLAAPLVGNDGRNLGLIQLSDKEDGAEFDEADEAMLVQLAQFASAAVEQGQAEAALRDREALFRTLIERSADAVQLVTPDGTILYSSDSVEAVLGYRPEEIAGRNVAPYVHPDDLPDVAAWIAGVAATTDGVGTKQYRVRHKDGSWAWVETTIANHLGTPSIGALVGNFRNITARKELERQKDEFVAAAAHELKTPVTSLKGFAQLLRNRFRRAGDEAAAALMETMDAQVDRLAALVGDLLDATRVEGGRLRLRPVPFDLDDLVNEVVAELGLTTERHRIRREGRAGVEIVGDRDRLGQVLTNYLSNAVKYSPTGGEVAVTTEADADGISVCVRDRGIGIPADEVPRVFDRFYRGSGEREGTYPGLGLGLYISAEIVRRHGGRVWATSAEGAGSTFCFRLPLRPPGPGGGPRADEEHGGEDR
jgi:PAS domain S-box-containing protein